MKAFRTDSSKRQLNHRFKTWLDERPVPPQTKKPDEPRYGNAMDFGAYLQLPLSILIAVVVGSLLSGGDLQLGVILSIAFTPVAFVIIVMLAILYGLIMDHIQTTTYTRAMRRSGWEQYNEALAAWKKRGETTFVNLDRDDYPLSMDLRRALR